MKILGIDSSGLVAGVAIEEDGKLISEYMIRNKLTHSQTLLPMIDEMMATSTPPYRLMEPNTLKIIELVRDFRLETHIPACFTLDAGPNVHLLYPDASDKQVKQFIKENLSQYCHDNQCIDDVVQNNQKL